MKILYAGDSPVGGAANYLLAVLRFLKADVMHLAPSQMLHPRFLRKRFSVIILSDFSKKRVPTASQKLIEESVEKGAGLLMIGGWASFSGPYGKWRGSMVEKLLPVACLNHDDRLNLPGGALIHARKTHPMFRSFSFKNPPVICGLNQVRAKKKSQLVLEAQRIWDGRKFPLLVIGSHPKGRTAAFTTDLAPHWCGGLVDWGSRRMRLRVKGKISVEVGDQYVRFVASLLKWLAGKN